MVNICGAGGNLTPLGALLAGPRNPKQIFVDYGMYLLAGPRNPKQIFVDHGILACGA